MWLLRSTVLVAALIAAPYAALGQENYFSGNRLLAWCTSFDPGKRNLCLGYIYGVAHALEGHVPDYRACIPREATFDQVADVALKWLEEHPQRRHYSAFSLAVQALDEAFPCKKN